MDKPTLGDTIAWAACAALMLSPFVFLVIFAIKAAFEDMGFNEDS